MTLEYRCSNCGTLLQTTNADPLHDEIERLRQALSAIHQIAEDYPANDSQLDRIQIITERVLNLTSG